MASQRNSFLLASRVDISKPIALCFLGLCLTIGCKEKPPEVVAVGGTVTINSKPLANATIVFLPMAEGLDGNYTASGVSDEDGKFTLVLPGKTESGCCACECKVMVQEGPLPDGARAEDGSGNAILAKYKRSLKNRPIPAAYQRVGSTPLTVDVTEANADVKLELKR